MYPSFLLLLVLPLVRAVAIPAVHDHDHVATRTLPTNWYHEEDHPVHALFKRGPDDGVNYPPVGSPTWSAGFPGGTPDPNALPQNWVAALNAAVAAGRIPSIPQPTQTAPSTNPIYPAGFDPNGPQVCSATYKCRSPDDVWDAPAGVFASSFDDGPVPSADRLIDFLNGNNLTTTHFMIGITLLQNPQTFLHAYNSGHDIAVHTWTHPYMTTLSNLDVLGQLGWTMQIIHNSTGGRVPRYWRPPYGDADNRVRAIAKEVFGLQTVIWNQDPQDWNNPLDVIQTKLAGFIGGPKSPGLIILEHEISDTVVSGFINSFPSIAANGWKFSSLVKTVNDGRTYQNAAGSNSNDVVPMPVGGTASLVPTSTTPTSTATSPPVSSVSAVKDSQPTPQAQKGSASASWPRNTALSSVLALIVTSLLW